MLQGGRPERLASGDECRQEVEDRERQDDQQGRDHHGESLELIMVE